MAKKRSPTKDYLVYILICALGMPLRLLPFRMVQKMGSGLGFLLYFLDAKHRKRVAENLSAAFPDITKAEMKRISVNHFRHLGMLALEIIWLPNLLKDGVWQRHMIFEDEEMQAIPRDGRPLIVVSGHIGNWEIGGIGSAKRGYQFNTVARPLDNPYLNRFLIEIRQKLNQNIIAKEGALLELMRILRAGGLVVLLVDQNAGRKGVFVDFFGRKASTIGSVAAMAIRTNARIVVTYCHRQEDGRFLLHADRLLDLDPGEYKGRLEEGTLKITQAFTSELERIVRIKPEQWLWSHRRWKTRPPEELSAQEKAEADKETSKKEQ